MNWLARNIIPPFFSTAKKSHSIETDNRQLATDNFPSCGDGHFPFAYLFARFPSFSQTFCFREVEGMLQSGLQFPIFSIHTPENEPQQDFPSRLSGCTTYLPKDIKLWARRTRKAERHFVRSLEKQLICTWGRQADKKRVQEAAWLLPILKKIGVQHVHVHFAGLAARVAYWLKKQAGIRYSFTAHANDFFVHSPHAYLPDLIQEAEFIATETNFSRDWLRQRFPSRAPHIHRLYNGIFVEKFAQQQRIPSTPARILAVGRYIEKKGFSHLIQACATLREEPFECLIVGEGPLEQTLKDQVQQSGLEGKVFIVGPRTESEIVDLFSSTSIFVFPCKKTSDGGMDNLPTVVMEAMSASVPVIATALAGIPEMILHGETGFLVNEGDWDALAFHIKALLQNPATAQKMGACGYQFAKEKFDISVTVPSLQSLLMHYGAIHGQE